MKYIELGVGNTWILRTESEFDDGSEIEHKGIIKPIIFHSIYLRIWIGKIEVARFCLLPGEKDIIRKKAKRYRSCMKGM
ncbi:DUF3977 family protein [Paenibacillus sp. V4I3]|uniref:DUF3977 family protein n=1 Tax=unclassified Paenibacillus TaxID=185978 RepID=UPI003594695A